MSSLHWMAPILPFPTIRTTQLCVLARLEANRVPSDEPTEEEFDQ